MPNADKTLRELRPTAKPNVIDLVAEAGLDVSDWANWKHGAQIPGANPRYSYEWCFEQEGMLVFNIWFENMRIEGDSIVQQLNLRKPSDDITGIRRVRALRFDNAARTAFENGINPRIIILDRKPSQKSADARSLDRSPWTVVHYDFQSGDLRLQRGIVPQKLPAASDPEAEQFPEGEPRMRFVIHRKREAQLRKLKIEKHQRENDGRLPCEVPNCGFDFEATYGDLGKNYTHVHHLTPLSAAVDYSIGNTVNDLAVVCANCHSMIHRGGECRPLSDVAPNPAS